MVDGIMLQLRRGQERGYANHGWLNSYHTFSFANYYDPDQMGFRQLRVINEDWVSPGHGFSSHSHRNMEILTFILEGALEHRDSLGTGAIIQPGEVQRMTAGTGITHSEFNPSDTEPVHLLQIWILPDQQRLPPSYEQKAFPLAERQGQLRLIAATDGRDGAVTIHQDVNLYTAVLEAGQAVNYQLQCDRYAWVQVAQGEIQLNNYTLQAGDGVAISQAESLKLSTPSSGELLLFDLA